MVCDIFKRAEKRVLLHLFNMLGGVTLSYFVLLCVFVLILVMPRMLLGKMQLKKWKLFTNFLSSNKEKMASVSGDTRTVKLDIFYITGFSMCVIGFQVNDDFYI
jgi:hypothetical protein